MPGRNSRPWWPWLLLATVVVAWLLWPRTASTPAPTLPPASTGATGSAPPLALPDPRPATTPIPGNGGLPTFLPREAADTIALIRRGGPFPYRQDGSVFGNREGHLPRRPRGWYREYTVDTPGLDHRGARRIITGGDPPQAWYYTDDHYDSFRRFDVPGGLQ